MRRRFYAWPISTQLVSAVAWGAVLLALLCAGFYRVYWALGVWLRSLVG